MPLNSYLRYSHLLLFVYLILLSALKKSKPKKIKCKKKKLAKTESNTCSWEKAGKQLEGETEESSERSIFLIMVREMFLIVPLRHSNISLPEISLTAWRRSCLCKPLHVLSISQDRQRKFIDRNSWQRFLFSLTLLPPYVYVSDHW